MEAQPKIASLPIKIPGYDRELRYKVRREATKVAIKPQFDFKEEESRYVLRSWLSEKRLARQQRKDFPLVPQTLTERKVVVDYFLEQFEHLRPSPTFRRRQASAVGDWPEDVADLVFDALRTFGFDALRLSVADTFRVRRPDKKDLGSGLLVALDRLGSVVGEILRDWQKRVRGEMDVRKRRQFQGYLKQIGDLLIPPTQGKRVNRIGISDDEVKKAYYQVLFRCEMALALLAKTKGRIRELPIGTLCAATDLPSEPKNWGYKGKVADSEYIKRNLDSESAKENACILVANRLGATLPTIRNIVSR